MGIREQRYKLADERNEKVNHRCVLCACGFPRGSRVATEHHEIISKAKIRGKHNLDRLYALPNIAPTCQYHHFHFQYLPIIWMKAMVRMNLASKSDYVDDPNWIEKYPPFDCMGEFGFGTDYYERVPEALAMGLTGTADDSPFCSMCPFAPKCQAQTKFVSGDSGLNPDRTR